MGVGDIDRVLKILQVLLGKLQRRFGQQHADKLLSYVESQRALGVRHLGAGNRGLVAGGLQAPLPFVSALEQIRNPDVELLGQVQIVGGEITRA